MSVADASSSELAVALLQLRSCVLAPLAPRTPHSPTYSSPDPYGHSGSLGGPPAGVPPAAPIHPGERETAARTVASATAITRQIVAAQPANGRARHAVGSRESLGPVTLSGPANRPDAQSVATREEQR